MFNQLIHEMKTNPQDFVLFKHYLRHVKTETGVWIANGFFFYEIERPYNHPFTLLEKFRFHRAFKKWKTEAPLGGHHLTEAD